MKSAESLVLNVGMVGGGEAANRVLSLFATLPGIHVRAITDPDPEADGVRAARRLGARYVESIAELVALPEVDTVMELSGRPERLRDVISCLRRDQELLRPAVASILLRVVEERARQKMAQMEAGVAGAASELASVTAELAEASSGIDESVSTLTSEAHGVAGAAHEMNESTARLVSNADAARDRLSDISGATKLLSASVGDIAARSQAARGESARAVESARTATASVQGLRETATVIAKVTRTIASIADRTKRLALNATIQAARAGDAGKGFAVVAGEVRELAHQTNAATDDIRDKVASILTTTRTTIEAINAIEEIVGSVSETIAHIVGAVDLQSTNTRAIAETIAEAASGLEAMSSLAHGVSLAANEVDERVGVTQDVFTALQRQSVALSQASHRIAAASAGIQAAVAALES